LASERPAQFPLRRSALLRRAVGVESFLEFVQLPEHRSVARRLDIGRRALQLLAREERFRHRLSRLRARGRFAFMDTSQRIEHPARFPYFFLELLPFRRDLAKYRVADSGQAFYFLACLLPGGRIEMDLVLAEQFRVISLPLDPAVEIGK